MDNLIENIYFLIRELKDLEDYKAEIEENNAEEQQIYEINRQIVFIRVEIERLEELLIEKMNKKDFELITDKYYLKAQDERIIEIYEI